MTPTKEQQAILDGFLNQSNNMKVLALAGTGKTSTLLELVETNPNTSFLYLSFNTVIRQEVELKAKARDLHNLKVKTQNGWALELARGAGLNCRDIKGYMSVKDTISRLRLTGNDRYLAYPAFQIMTRFAISKDDSITLRHVPKDVQDRIYTNIRRFSNMNEQAALAETDRRVKKAVSIAQQLFASFNFNSDVMLHDIYVKLVQLHYNQIDIAEDVVLLDEAQDINPVFADIFSKTTSRQIAVGDSNQAIYQFRGAQDFLSEMPAESVFTLTQSFRFLPEIADKANLLLQHMTDLRLKGFDGVEEEDTSAILCRTNMGCLMEAVASMESEISFRLEGGIDNEGFRMIEDIVALYEGNVHDVRHPDLKGIRTFHDFQKELEEDLLNNEWKTSLRVIDRMGGFEEAVSTIRKIKETQRSVPKNAKVITTMHKSKGKEWNSVRIADDAENVFYSSSVDSLGRKSRIAIAFKDAPVMEKNLFYVAVTRAKRNLELGLCERLFEREETANTTPELVASEVAA
jgi:F-box protein 18 (helicase)